MTLRQNVITEWAHSDGDIAISTEPVMLLAVIVTTSMATDSVAIKNGSTGDTVLTLDSNMPLGSQSINAYLADGLYVDAGASITAGVISFVWAPA